MSLPSQTPADVTAMMPDLFRDDDPLSADQAWGPGLATATIVGARTHGSALHVAVHIAFFAALRRDRRDAIADIVTEGMTRAWRGVRVTTSVGCYPPSRQSTLIVVSAAPPMRPWVVADRVFDAGDRLVRANAHATTPRMLARHGTVVVLAHPTDVDALSTTAQGLKVELEHFTFDDDPRGHAVTRYKRHRKQGSAPLVLVCGRGLSRESIATMWPSSARLELLPPGSVEVEGQRTAPSIGSLASLTERELTRGRHVVVFGVEVEKVADLLRRVQASVGSVDAHVCVPAGHQPPPAALRGVHTLITLRRDRS